MVNHFGKGYTRLAYLKLNTPPSKQLPTLLVVIRIVTAECDYSLPFV